MVARHKVVPSVYLFLRNGNKILLIRRFNTGFEDGKYGFPAGHAEEAEILTNAMIREAKEEIGIDILSENLKVVHLSHRKALNDERVDICFECTIWEGEVVNNEPNKCDDLMWFELDTLPKNFVSYMKVLFDDFMEGKFYGEFGWD